MNFIEGQALLGRIMFKDGKYPSYDRTYLIVKVEDDYIEVLNVSSLKGKERKLAFSTNRKIHLYNPPFMKPSFVKLDSLTRINKCDYDRFHLLCKGKCMDKHELRNIQNALNGTQ